jgi:hypothetical protein
VSEYKVGDRVRITFVHEGTVRRAHNSPESVIEFTDGRHVFLDGAFGSEPTVEVIEPEYEVGSVYMDAMGETYYRLSSSTTTSSSWRSASTGVVRRHSWPHRPLRKLVPEGE